MNRSIIALILTVLLVACEAPTVETAASTPEAVSSEAKFSWENSTEANSAPAVIIEAPKDTTKARIIEIREGSGLIALAMAEKPAVRTHLQIIKDNKVLLVDVASTNEKQVVVNIIPNQLKRPELLVGDEVICTPDAAPAAQ
jgi:hypothetical protein